eukprot:TRINITY_DN30748_c0_g1_i1.p1 TRINITY_DN30748_c0_g1~~TRINITY_DN30748_c0_g1_i1.p1  ORF type:complete len:553 (+),score=54.82 TRINITY_DN30748_c0_g1_i1:94-1752(+)
MTRPDAAPQTAAPLLPHEMEQIRRVFDEDQFGKKHSSIITPRDDAHMFRNVDMHATPCECIIELYELLWRWGHRTPNNSGFAQNFGFSIPDTIVIVKGKPYAWYFISKKDGKLLRKSDNNLKMSGIEKKLCPEAPPGVNERATAHLPCAVWMPMATQFPEARCHSPNAEFLSTASCQKFLGNLSYAHSGILQQFVDPHGVSNFLVRTVEFRRTTSLVMRTNRALLNSTRLNLFDRCATFEGWEGLSSLSSRYRNHRHPHMEDLILAAGETLNRRIDQERVRQMLFLGPHQHVALHFKVSGDHQLHFIFASVVSEKDVILQTRPQLLMGDPCMTEELPGTALLPGGTTRKMQAHEAPACYSARGAGIGGHARPVDSLESGAASSQHSRKNEYSAYGAKSEALEPPASYGGGYSEPARYPREGSLPPIGTGRREDGNQTYRRPLSDRQHQRNIDNTCIPRMGIAKPEIPELPYSVIPLPANFESEAHFEPGSLPRYAGLTSFKRPLVVPNSARSEPGGSSNTTQLIQQPASAHSAATFTATEPVSVQRAAYQSA